MRGARHLPTMQRSPISASEKAIDLVVVGPEAPLVAGLADDLRAAGIRVFGPSRPRRNSKAPRASPRICAPDTASRPPPIGRFDDAAEAQAPMSASQGAPIVVKADGIAAGKGVTVAMTVDEALAAVDACFGGAFGERRRRSRDRGVPRRRGGELLLPLRRRDRAAVRHGAGPQARRRRRHRAEHRRHGRLFAGAGDDARARSSGRCSEIVEPTMRGMAETRRAVFRRAVRRADDHAPRARS